MKFALFFTATEAITRAMFGEGSGEILLDEVQCTGSESRLIDCPANPLGVSDCRHREDAGVRCRGTSVTICLACTGPLFLVSRPK